MATITVDRDRAFARASRAGLDRRWVFPLMTLMLALTYSSAIFLKYTLSDEHWIIRASKVWLRFDLRQGRPLFSLSIYATSLLHDRIGFDVVRVLRIGAVVGLAAAMSLLVAWLERWGVKRMSAVLMVAVLATFPPFQIYIVDATWLVIPLLATISAMLLLHRALDGPQGQAGPRSLLPAAIVLLVLSLAFYQPAMLVGFGMLTVPLLWMDVRDSAEVRHRVRFVGVAAALLIASIVVYYLVWLALWWTIEDHAMFYYGPTAFSTDPAGRLRFFFYYRLMQTFNLWHVATVKPTWFLYGSLVVIAAGAAADLERALTGGRPGQGLAGWGQKYLGTTALLVACDGIPLAATIQIWSYVTMPALYLAATVLLAWSIHGTIVALRWRSDRLFPAVLGAGVAAGIFMAQYAVLTYFALPLFVENQIVKRGVQDYLKTHATLTRVHVVGRSDVIMNSGFMEYGWTNSRVDTYIRDMVKNVLDDLHLPSDIEVTAVSVAAAQLGTPSPVPADALVIDLSRVNLR